MKKDSTKECCKTEGQENERNKYDNELERRESYPLVKQENFSWTASQQRPVPLRENSRLRNPPGHIARCRSLQKSNWRPLVASLIKISSCASCDGSNLIEALDLIASDT